MPRASSATGPNFGDMILVFIFGVLGWFMVQFKWPRPPMVLGLVLGDIAERNFFIAVSTYDYRWLVHPGVIVIFLLMVGVLAYSILQMRKRPKEQRATVDLELQVVIRRPIFRSLFALFFVVTFAYVVYGAYFGYGASFPSAGLFPVPLSWLLATQGSSRLIGDMLLYVKQGASSPRLPAANFP